MVLYQEGWLDLFLVGNRYALLCSQFQIMLKITTRSCMGRNVCHRLEGMA